MVPFHTPKSTPKSTPKWFHSGTKRVRSCFAPGQLLIYHSKLHVPSHIGNNAWLPHGWKVKQPPLKKIQSCKSHVFCSWGQLTADIRYMCAASSANIPPLEVKKSKYGNRPWQAHLIFVTTATMVRWQVCVVKHGIYIEHHYIITSFCEAFTSLFITSHVSRH